MGVRHAWVASAVGPLLVVADGDALTGLYFQGHRYPPPAGAVGRRADPSTDAVLSQAERELGEYFAGRRRVFDVRVATDGNDFQERVWAILRAIPYGQRITYGDIAVAIGDKSLSQSVGQAVGRNPVSIIIPCHRVVGADGKLTGFAGGLARKTFLLELEEPAAVRAGRLF